MTCREVAVLALSARRRGWPRLAAAGRLLAAAAAAVTVIALGAGAVAMAGPAAAASTGQVSAVGAGKCLDVPGSSVTPGTQLDIWTCSGGANQAWAYTSAGQFTVYSGSSQLCLDAAGNRTTPGTKVETWTCNGQANQQWNVNANGTITGVQSGLCLDVTGASTANGALVELWTCNGGSNQQWATSSGGSPVITISAAGTGTSLTASSAGLSFEASDLAVPGFTAGNLAAYLKTLGTSVLRIGGNTVDQTFWTSTGAPAPSWAIATITPADLTALASLARASDWKVILGVNLEHYNPASAADEAQYARAALGSSLQAIEIGNEPNFYPQYSGNTGQYFNDFQAYVSAIEQAVPGVPIAGGDVYSAPTSSFQSAFVSSEHALSKPDIAELTSHNYPLTASSCGGGPTIAGLLGTSTHNEEVTAAQQAAAGGSTLGVPAVIDEGNSVVCEGQPGVSDVYASALWEVDDQLATALDGVQGDYMHGTVIQCDTAKPLFMYYTPLCAPTAADATTGILAAQPEYYGLAAVHEIGAGQFLNLSNPDSANVRAYAIRHADGTVTVVLDDVQDPASSGPSTLRLVFGQSFSGGSRFDLTASSLSATSGITLGGQSVQASGALAAPNTTPVTVSGSTLTVTVASGSAAILTLG
jgi:hypothetical protein